MKIVKILVTLLIVVSASLYILLFTSVGNSIVRPYAQKVIKEKTKQDIVFEKFKISFNKLDIEAILNNEVVANLNGKFNIFSTKFDLNYNLNLKDLKSFEVKLQKPISFNGQIRGKLSNFAVNGSGSIFGSNTVFLVEMVNYIPINAQVDAKDFDIEEIESFLSVSKFAQGKIDITANIKNKNGVANIISKNATLNQNAFADINITIPKNTELLVKSDITMNENKVSAKSSIDSSLINLHADKTTYDINTNTLDSDFAIDIQKLQNLEPIIGKKLNGALKAQGKLQYSNNKLQFADVQSNIFSGQINARFENENIKANIDNAQLSEILNMFNIDKFASGKINANINFDKVFSKNSVGKADILLDGVLNSELLNKNFGLNIAKNTNYKVKNTTTIENSKITANSLIDSGILKSKKLIATYDIENSSANVDLDVIIPEINKIINSSNGEILIDAKASTKKSEIESINANIKQKNGFINITSNGKKLDANINNLDLGALLAIAGQPVYALGNINGEAHLDSLDIKNLNGNANIKISNGIFNSSVMSKILEKSFPQNSKFSLTNTTKIKNSIVYFSNIFNSDLFNFNKFDGNFDITKTTLNSDFIAEIQDFKNIEFLTQRKLNGSIIANGNIKFNKTLNADINSDFLKGKINANLANNNLKAQISNVDFHSLTNFLNYSHFYDGVINGDLNYNLLSKNGKFNAKVDNGRLTQNTMTQLILATTGRDLTTEIYENSTLNGVIAQDLVTFNAHMVAKRSEINATQGTINTKTSAINIPISANVENTDLMIKINGTTQDPKINVSSKYLEKKLDKLIDKGIDKLFKKDKKDNSGDIQENHNDADTAKDILKGIKSLF